MAAQSSPPPQRGLAGQPRKVNPVSVRRRALCVRALFIAGAVSGIAACTMVGPDYVRPAFDSPARYKEANPAPTLGAAIAPDDGKWWQIYRDPTLDTLVQQVSASNQSLAAADARVREARQLSLIASSALAPSVGAGSFRSGRKNGIDFGLMVSWELDLWGRIRRDIEAHKASAQASADDLAAATLSMQAQVVQSYFAVRETDAVIDLLQQALDVDDQWARMVRNQSTQGIASAADVAAALARQSVVQLQLANAKTSRAQFEHALAVMTGKPPADFAIAPAPFQIDVPVIPAGLPATLLHRRPDVAASERRMAAASARVGVSKAETLPTVNLAAGLGVLKGPRATVDLHAPLYTNGRLQAQVGQAWAAYAESVANYRQTVLDAFREVEDNLVAADNLASTSGSQSMAASAARKSERVTRNQYQKGVADYPAIVEAQSASLDTGRAELQLRLERLNTSVNLVKALGGGWHADAEPDTHVEEAMVRQSPVAQPVVGEVAPASCRP
ncbi:efflux transporter outer membrane subunit [Burkholderia sp. 22PA0106]|uniref:efflux transporter outer membrane subunit n=1 Tax=Burkholderia sp. 22PA0106 TaxID=3237371 RepID=UPI0039C16E93